MVDTDPVLELKKRLEAYGFEVIRCEPESVLPELESVEPVEPETETQLSFELERPVPRLHVLRRHPSI